MWDAHAGIFPSPDVDLDIPGPWQIHDVNYLSINVGFDVMQRDETLVTLAAYRRWILDHPENSVLAGALGDIKAAQKDR